MGYHGPIPGAWVVCLGYKKSPRTNIATAKKTQSHPLKHLFSTLKQNDDALEKGKGSVRLIKGWVSLTIHKYWNSKRKKLPDEILMKRGDRGGECNHFLVPPSHYRAKFKPFNLGFSQDFF